MSTAETNLLADVSQFRISRLQVFNWGTFSGYHDIAVSPKGFLFVGASGSGKSTLLDAMVTLLLPQPEYNAAAHEGEKGRRHDRSLMSYVRGAWSSATEYDPTGRSRSVVKYLREGPTFSAVALTLFDALGDCRTLLLVAYVKGKSTEERSVTRQFMILPGDYGFELSALAEFARTDFDFKVLKRRLPDGLKSFTTFTGYCDAFCDIFGIRDQTALKLLSKAQSAKNLGDLNTFLRTFMLDEPKTLAVADTLVSEFGELSEAHHAVVQAREQHEILASAKKAWDAAQAESERTAERARMRAALPAWELSLDMKLTDALLPKLRDAAATAQAAERSAEAVREAASEDVKRLEQLHYASGGEAVAQLNRSIAHERETEERIGRTQKKVLEALRTVGRPLPDTAEDWRALTSEMRLLLEERERLEKERMSRRDEAVAKLTVTEREFESTVREVRAMRERPSNIPANLLDLRRTIAEGTGLTEDALPFVGELLEVKREEADWQGAIERVLHNFALSILVEDRHYRALSDYVDTHRLGGRLVYFRVRDEDRTADEPAFLGEDRLNEKLNIATGPWRAWLANELARRFDYVCVESTEAFRKTEKAVTRAGQTKVGGVRHEKDDRTAVDDRRRWVTGFSNAEKLAVFEAEAQRLGDEISALRAAKDAVEREVREAQARLMAAQKLTDYAWEDVALSEATARRVELEKRLAELLSDNLKLKTIEAELELARKKERAALEAYVTRSAEARQERTKFEQLEAHRAEVENDYRARVRDLPDGFLDENDVARLAARLPEGVRLTPSNLRRTVEAVREALADEERAGVEARARWEGEAVRQFAVFRQRFPARAAEWDASIEAAPEHFAFLEELERDGLPKYEGRFRELLEKQSLQNFTELSTQILASRREIFDRMRVVNLSLSDVAFSRLETGDTHLRIEVTDRHIAEVEEFRRALRGILEGAWEKVSAEEADERFERISALVGRMGSGEPDAVRWRALVLDVRNHVEFSAVEFDEDDQIVETYLSGAGKSGGQRQKLTTTCLAAALRYQLGSSEAGLPAFAPVILDEAFDKADSEFTDISMNIFRQFGFQMIVATPEKAVYTLEPYIGGACLVAISDRRRSGVLGVAYDAEKSALDWESTGPAGSVGLSRADMARRELREALKDVEAARSRPKRLTPEERAERARRRREEAALAEALKGPDLFA